MKKLSFISLSLVLLAVSCGPKPEEQVKEFAVKFGDFVNSNQKDSIQAYYPGFLLTDSVGTVSVSNITVIPENSEDLFTVEYSPETFMMVRIEENGNLYIEESKGLLAFPNDKIEFAKKTGMWDNHLSDVELSKRMNDEAFFNYLNSKANDASKNPISIGKFKVTKEWDGGPMDIGQGYNTLTNNTDVEIKGSEYDIIIRSENPMTEATLGTEVKPGKDIPPHGSVNINSNFSARSFNEVSGVKFKLSDEELRNKFSPFTGNEYQEYLNSKK